MSLPHPEELEAIIPDTDRLFLEDKEIDPKYHTDHSGQLKARAHGVALPKDANEVSRLLDYASRYQVPVTPRGAGTNLTGSTLPLKGGLVIDLSLMNRILDLDEKTLSVTVEPGVLLEDLQAYVESKGFFYPPDPGEKKSTIAGNISTNAGGMRAVKYGVTRDYIRALDVVLADGRQIQLGGTTIKDASGLALKEAVIGSEGTLGIITKVVLKILPKPEFSCSALAAFENLSQAADCVLKILASFLKPTAVEFMNREVVALGENFLHTSYPCPQAGSYILLTFDGTREEVAKSLEALDRLARKNHALDVIVLDDPEYASRIWQVRGALCTAVEAVSQQEPIDIVVPLDRIPDFIGRVSELEAEYGLQMVSFGHAGDGNVHLCIVRGTLGQQEWEQKLAAVLEELYACTYASHGLASGEHGIGLQKRIYFHKHTDPVNIALMNGIKDAFDPAHILNDGKSYVLENTPTDQILAADPAAPYPVNLSAA